MQGINKSRHKHLIDALLQMERLLSKECKCLQQTSEYRIELEMMHHNYEHLLDELAKQIKEYEILFDHIKIQFLGKKLKELKKDIPADRAASPPALIMLHHNIQLAYGT